MTDQENLRFRLIRALPANLLWHMDVSQMPLHLTDSVPTLAVKCGVEPVMLLNPNFLAEHCQTDEHLAMAVMHELLHIILGHTRLFENITRAQEIAFDALINALLCHRFPAPAYTSFFTDYYGSAPESHCFPFTLLRPPVAGDEYPTPAVHKVLNRLYGDWDQITLTDLVALFPLFPQSKKVKPPLLGHHPLSEDDETQENSETAQKAFSMLMEADFLPQPDLDPHNYSLAIKPTRPSLKKQIDRLMRLCRRPARSGRFQRTLQPVPVSVTTLVPNMQDRRHLAREAVTSFSPFYEQEQTQLVPLATHSYSTFVYLDVSGSMMQSLPELYAALSPYLRRKQCRLFGFSTQVVPLTPAQVQAGNVPSTGNTSIECVLEHLLSLPPSQCPTAVLLLTDGLTGRPSQEELARVQQAKILFYCGLVDSNDQSDLRELVERFVPLCTQKAE